MILNSQLVATYNINAYNFYAYVVIIMQHIVVRIVGECLNANLHAEYTNLSEPLMCDVG